MSYISMLFFIYLTERRCATAGRASEHENDTNMERQKLLYLFINCHQTRVVHRTSTEEQNHPWRTFVEFCSSKPIPIQWGQNSSESDSPISSPLLAWLPWPFSRGVPLSISKPTPYTEESLCGTEMGEREWGNPLRRTFCWRRCPRLSSTFRIEEYAM